MQRDIDLLRNLLLATERRGVSCPIDVLCCDVRRDEEERIRYHIRLLVDAGLLKEAGQNPHGVPSVRLTHEGLEFVELARSDVRWSAAKASVRAATGGLPLATLKSLLARRAWRLVVRNERRPRIRTRGRVQRYVERVPSIDWIETQTVEPEELWDDDQARYHRSRYAVGSERIPPAWDADLYGDLATELCEFPTATPLPENLL